MGDKGWSKTEIKMTEELPKNDWALGYFRSSHYNWDGKTACPLNMGSVE